jgi:hypothetical protein
MAESVVTLWSKSVSPFSAAVPDFPGVNDKTLVDSKISTNDIADLYGVNGTYVQSDTTGTASVEDVGGGLWELTMASISGVEVGMYAYLRDWAGASLNGVYRITSFVDVATVGIDIVGLATPSGFVDGDTCDVYIGGVSDAFDGSTTLQDELDSIGPRCGATDGDAVNNLDILCHASTATTLTDTLDIDNISGGTNTRTRALATNASFVRDGTKVEITTSTTLPNGLLEFFSLSDNTLWFDFDFNANSNAAYAINNPPTESSSEQHVFKNCLMRGATTRNLHNESPNWNLSGCTISDGEAGIFNDGDLMVIENCHISGSNTNGISLSARTYIIDNIIEGHGTNGLTADSSADFSKLLGNTFKSNGTNGVNLDNGANNFTISGNTSSGNGTGAVSGFGYNFGSTFRANILFFANNHSFDNLDGHSNLMSSPTSDTEFTDFLDLDNITGDPLLDANFIPSSSSPLIDAGVGGTGDTIGAKCATAGGGAGGGVMPLTGLLS